MKRWIVTLQWHEDLGMYETRTTAKEVPIRAADEEAARKHAETLVRWRGAHDYELTEA